MGLEAGMIKANKGTTTPTRHEYILVGSDMPSVACHGRLCGSLYSP